MTENVCKSCHKPFLADRAGSVTSFFFQHNYCQCHNADANLGQATPSKASSGSALADSQICNNCGKSRPTAKRAGSFTSFLFKELRCTCAGSSGKNSGRGALQFGRTTTAARTAQRKQFTQSIRNKTTSSHKQAAPSVLPAETIIGGFKIISLVGVGGMGAVYLVEHMSLHRQLALKILTPELVNEQSWQRFKAEAKILAALNHSTLVRVYDLGIHENSIPFYSMDYLDGRSIEEILAQDGPVDLESTIDILVDVLDGLAYAHRNGIVHRDLKPGNIMSCTIDGANAVKVLDFGISKLIDNRSTAQTMTVAGDIFGSPFYMSPEQSLGERVDARSDIYSIGCTLFEMLTGYVPYENQSSIEIMLMHQEADIPLLSDVCQTDFPPSLDLVISKCLAKSPDNRYQSAKELALDLIRIKEGKEVSAYAKGFAQRSTATSDQDSLKNETSVSTVVLTCLAAAILIVSGLVLYYWLNQQKQASKPSAKVAVNANFAGDDVLPESEFSELGKNKKMFFSTPTKDGQSLVFNFPSNTSLGKIARDAPAAEVFEAQGQVTLAIKNGIKFEANHFLIENATMFQGFRPNDLVCLSTPFSSDEILKIKPALPQMCALTGLRRLDIQLSDVDDNDIPYINNLTNLTELDINFTEVTGNGLAKLNRIKKLNRLSFNYNKGAHEVIAALKGNDSIFELYFDSTDKALDIEDIKALSKLPNLKFISLQNSGVTDKSLEALYGMPQLETLNINDCTVSKEAIEKFRKSYGSRQINIVSTAQELLRMKGGGKGDANTGL